MREPEPDTASLPLGIPSVCSPSRPSRPDGTAVRTARDSFWLLGNVADLADAFDRHLLLLAPRAEGAVADRRREGAERLVTALLRAIEAVGATGSADQAVEQLHRVGTELAGSGLTAADLRAVGHALVRAVREAYTEEWTTRLGSSWSALQEWTVEHLVRGARNLRGAVDPVLEEAHHVNDRLGLSTIDLTGLNGYHVG